MFNELAIMMIMMWPAVPMFLIELHLSISFWRRLGLWTYLVIIAEWLPIGITLLLLQGIFLSRDFTLGLPFLILGIVMIVMALVLHGWTAKLICLKATIGYSELKPNTEAQNHALVTTGPFSIVRHPSYWAHAAIMLGIFFVTGVVATGIIALIDLAINYFVTTTLEDHELVDRFGDQYRQYQKSVPKFFPKVTKR